MEGLRITRDGDDSLISVRVTPRSSKSVITGVAAGELRVRLAAPPVEGAANEELIETLARWLKRPKSSLSVKSGAAGRGKVVRVAGVTPENLKIPPMGG